LEIIFQPHQKLFILILKIYNEILSHFKSVFVLFLLLFLFKFFVSFNFCMFCVLYLQENAFESVHTPGKSHIGNVR